MYVADAGNSLIRKITPAGVVTTLAGNRTASGLVNAIGTAAQFNNPLGVAVDIGANVYIADANNNAIRAMT